MPKTHCDDVFETADYEATVNNLAALRLAGDMVLRDGATLETPTVAGNVEAGVGASMGSRSRPDGIQRRLETRQETNAAARDPGEVER